MAYLLYLRTVVPPAARPKRVPCHALELTAWGIQSWEGPHPMCGLQLPHFKDEETHRVTASVRTEADWLPEVPLSPTWNPWCWFSFPGHHSPFIPAPRCGIPCVNSGVIKHASWESHFLFL